MAQEGPDLEKLELFLNLLLTKDPKSNPTHSMWDRQAIELQLDLVLDLLGDSSADEGTEEEDMRIKHEKDVADQQGYALLEKAPFQSPLIHSLRLRGKDIIPHSARLFYPIRKGQTAT